MELAEHFLATPHQGKSIFYGEVGTWYGALTFAQLSGDTALRDKLIKRFDPLLPGGAETNLIGQRKHVDDEIFGSVPLEIAIQTKDAKYLAYGKKFADQQWENPQPDGLSGETRYWIDDMYMLTILQLEAYRATGDKQYLDRGAKEMVAYLDKLQQPNGLFFHAARRALLLGTRQWLDRSGHDGDAAELAGKPSAESADFEGLSADDGRIAEVSEQGRQLASVDRQGRGMAGKLIFGDVHIRHDLRREGGLAGRKDLWPSCAQELDRGGGIYRSEWRRD